MNGPRDTRSVQAKAYHWASRVNSIALERVIPGLLGYWLDNRVGTQGLFTVCVQTACEETRLPPAVFRVVTDTREALACGQTTASRGTVLAASAIIEACRKWQLDLDRLNLPPDPSPDEARAGHIPGAVNRPFTEDIVTINGITNFGTIEGLAAAYAQLIPSKESVVIVHCRTGHQASQTFFVLRHLLGYSHLFWYDGGWSEWAARP